MSAESPRAWVPAGSAVRNFAAARCLAGKLAVRSFAERLAARCLAVHGSAERFAARRFAAHIPAVLALGLGPDKAARWLLGGVLLALVVMVMTNGRVRRSGLGLQRDR